MIKKIDFESYVRSRVEVRNVEGGRGYDLGVRSFDCPLCDDMKSRGWVNVDFATAGCFNAGCVASERLTGGAVEWARQQEGFSSRGKTISYLQTEFPSHGRIRMPALPRLAYDDFCHFPKEMLLFKLPPAPILQAGFLNFAWQQWGLNIQDLITAGAGYCVKGFYSHRIVLPIVMDRQPVAFQARTILSVSMFPKYLTSSNVQQGSRAPECGRPAEALLYGIDEVKPGDEVTLVEGGADAIAARRRQGLRAVGLLGTALTSEKLALLARTKPSKVIVALDAEAETSDKALEAFAALISWGMDAALGTWTGGKDPGSGGRLIPQTPGILVQITQKLGKK